MNRKNKNDLTAQQRRFIQEISDLTERGIIQWHRNNDELHATINLELWTDFSDSGEPTRSLVVAAPGDAHEMYVPLSADVLLEQFAELEEMAEHSAEEVAAS